MHQVDFNHPKSPSCGHAGNDGRHLSESLLAVEETHSNSNSGFGRFDLTLPVESEVAALSLSPDTLDDVSDQVAERHDNVMGTFAHGNPIDAEKSITLLPHEQQLEQFISYLLKYGVLLSSAIVLVGGVLYLIRQGAEPANYRFFQGEPAEFRSPAGVVRAVLSGSRRGIIQLGLLILIATPISRVAFSFLAFLRQRDWVYIIITLSVLVGLIYSLVGAYS
ncbi:MAG TPA: DUF1634 domain-containing protein [Waterburya sp.]